MFKISTIALAIAVAATMFWATMLTDPPKTEASAPRGAVFMPGEIVIPSTLPEADAVSAH
jgi:hypothetical protein